MAGREHVSIARRENADSRARAWWRWWWWCARSAEGLRVRRESTAKAARGARSRAASATACSLVPRLTAPHRAPSPRPREPRRAAAAASHGRDKHEQDALRWRSLAGAATHLLPTFGHDSRRRPCCSLAWRSAAALGARVWAVREAASAAYRRLLGRLLLARIIRLTATSVGLPSALCRRA